MGQARPGLSSACWAGPGLIFPEWQWAGPVRGWAGPGRKKWECAYL